jgi:fructose/tagatose bisphosphate aldolase
VLGAVAGAHHVRMMAKHYGVPVVLHSDHCAKKLLPWFDGMLDADEEYFKVRRRKFPVTCCKKEFPNLKFFLENET